MTGQARRDAAAGGPAARAAAGALGALDPRAAVNRDALLPGDHAGNRVATDTSRGDSAAVVVPGRALGNRLTTEPGVAGVSELVGELVRDATEVVAAPFAGATERIALADAGRTVTDLAVADVAVAVSRSSWLLPAARSNDGPRAANPAGSAAEPARARPPIEASASPATGT